MHITKICTKCNKEKELSKFSKHQIGKDGLESRCKKCKSNYDQKNKIKLNKQRRSYYKKYPWIIILKSINERCNNPKNKDYKNYGKRGIKNYLKLEDVKFLYIRDKAHLMKKPSIDRKDNNGNYTIENCEFIEFSENSAKDKRKIILQYHLDGKFIKEWRSIIEASKILKIHSGDISYCAKGKSKTCGGFIWRYKSV